MMISTNITRSLFLMALLAVLWASHGVSANDDHYYSRYLELAEKDNEADVRGRSESRAYRYLQSLSGNQALLLAKQAACSKQIEDLSGREYGGIQWVVSFALQEAAAELGQEQLTARLMEEAADPKEAPFWRGLALGAVTTTGRNPDPEKIRTTLGAFLAFVRDQRKNATERAWLLGTATDALYRATVRFYESQPAFRRDGEEGAPFRAHIQRARPRGVRNPYEDLLHEALLLSAEILPDEDPPVEMRKAAADSLDKLLAVCGDKEFVRRQTSRVLTTLVEVAGRAQETAELRKNCMFSLRALLRFVDADGLNTELRDVLLEVVRRAATDPEVSVEAGAVLVRGLEDPRACQALKEKLKTLEPQDSGSLRRRYERLIRECERIASEQAGHTRTQRASGASEGASE